MPPSTAAPPLAALAAALVPGGRLLLSRPLAPDTGGRSTHKAEGYGEPLLLVVGSDGGERRFVLRTAGANDFGHDRRSDRAQQILLAYDTFGEQPAHVRAVDVGAVGPGGRLISLRDAGELYLVTDFADGAPYADDLRRLAETGEASERDLRRLDLLVAHLAALHAEKGGRPARYVRAIRDLVGHGEGIFGIVDGYPDDTPGAPPQRLRRLEEMALAWRWKLRGREGRLARTHGDFHPFNILFGGEDQLTLLDASRGGRGDPADDVAALAVNYVFFALPHPRAWPNALGPLWRRLFRGYLEATSDGALLDVIGPFFAWRALVVSCPRFYPQLAGPLRDRMLTLAERALARPRFHPEWAEELFS